MVEFSVGQLLFIVSADSAGVVPVVISERRTIETTSGVQIKHIVKTPGQKNVVLESIKGTFHTDVHNARQELLKNATAAIDSLIERSQKLAIQAFGADVLRESSKQVQVEQIPTEQIDESDKLTEIMLPDGSIQKVKVKFKI